MRKVKVTIHFILTKHGKMKKLAFRDEGEAYDQAEFFDSDEPYDGPHRVHTINRTVRLKSGKILDSWEDE